MLNHSKSQPHAWFKSRLFWLAAIPLLASASFCATAFAQWKISGTDVPQLAAFDSAMKTLMTAQGATSAQLAVTWQGRLVLGHGYSLNPATQDTITEPDSLFRIASVSKPITATLVHRLIQDGKSRHGGVRDADFQAIGTANRSRIPSSPNVASTSFSRSVATLRGKFLNWAMISSFFIECSQPTSSVTVTL